MVSTTTVQVVSDICNAESAVDLHGAMNFKQIVLSHVKSLREKVLTLRSQMGLHRLETDKHRRERWDITSAKLMALTDVADFVETLPDPDGVDYLTGRKSILQFVEQSAQLHGVHAHFYGERQMTESAAIHRHKQAALVSILEHAAADEPLSGSAGTQPLTGEETPAAKELRPASTLANYVSLDDGSSVSEFWLETATVEQLHRLSETVLDALEARGVVTHWSLNGM